MFGASIRAGGGDGISITMRRARACESARQQRLCPVQQRRNHPELQSSHHFLFETGEASFQLTTLAPNNGCLHGNAFGILERSSWRSADPMGKVAARPIRGFGGQRPQVKPLWLYCDILQPLNARPGSLCICSARLIVGQFLHQPTA